MVDLKWCGTCKTNKIITDFNKNKSRKDGFSSICRECSKNRSRKYYMENREKHKKNTYERTLKQRERNRQFIFEYLLEHHCVDCGESDPIVQEFDHLPGKEKKRDINEMMNQGHSIKNIKEEIAKCEVVCANCHKKRTTKRGNHYRYRMLKENMDLDD